jgi:hypothetical protein
MSKQAVPTFIYILQETFPEIDSLGVDCFI